MLIVNQEECTDNVISYQFHVQSRLNCLGYNNITIVKSIIYCLVESNPEVTFVPNMRFLQKENSLPFI